MDAEAYKVYNFMVNRASGACSAIKQEQFRALTEITINRMMQLTQSQLTAMHEALQNQQKFNEIEIANFEGLNENEEKIRDGQVENLEKLKNVGNLIDENLQHMLEIRKKSEAKFTEMGKSAEVISQKLNQHTTELHVGHEKLIKDVDEISLHLQKSNLELIHQYNQTLEFFQNFKTLMILLSNMTDNIKSFIEKIMLTVHDVGLEFTDEFLASMFLNLIYFTCGMIFMLFINAHGTCKIYLVGLFVYNTAAAYFQPDISLFPMNIFFWLCYIGELVSSHFLNSNINKLVAMKALSIIKKRLAFESFKIDFRPLLARLPKWRWTLKRTRENSESDSDGYYYERSPTPKPSLSGPYKAEECRSNLGLGKSRLTTNYLSAVRTHSKNAVDDNEVGSFFNEINKSPMSIRSNESSSSYTRPSTPLARPRTPAIERILRETIPDRYTPFVTGMAGRIPCTGITAKGLQCKNAAVAGMDKCRLH